MINQLSKSLKCVMINSSSIEINITQKQVEKTNSTHLEYFQIR